jgi:hypothetical protein
MIRHVLRYIGIVRDVMSARNEKADSVVLFKHNTSRRGTKSVFLASCLSKSQELDRTGLPSSLSIALCGILDTHDANSHYFQQNGGTLPEAIKRTGVSPR